jgi:CRP/FNR family transcriptional regulator
MDALVDDGFVRTLSECHRAAHDVLRYYGFYSSSSSRQRLEILEAAQPLSPPVGRTLMESGYTCSNVVFVGHGRLRVYISGESGREVTLYYVKSGESCPVNLGSALTGVSACASSTADGGVSAVSIQACDFRRISQRNAEVRDYVFTATVLRFGEIIALIRQITTQRVDQRLAEYLLRKFEISEETPAAALETHQSIAHELGTAREVISRRLQELESMGAIRLRRARIELTDRRALRRVIE